MNLWLFIFIIGVIGLYFWKTQNKIVLPTKQTNTDVAITHLLKEQKDLFQKIIKEKEELIRLMKSEISQLNDSTCDLNTQNFKLFGKQKSEQVRLGKITENILPFVENFPYECDKLRGLFNPIDLLYFGEDEIVFVEVKTGNSQMSKKQKQIKKLIEEGKVRFELIRINEKGYKIE